MRLPASSRGLDGREEKGEASGQPGLSGIEQHAARNGLAVGVDEGGAECASAPEDEGRADGLFGAEAADGEGPRDLENDGTDAREGVDVTKLAALEANVFVEAKDPGISELGWMLVRVSRAGQGLHLHCFGPGWTGRGI